MSTYPHTTLAASSSIPRFAKPKLSLRLFSKAPFVRLSSASFTSRGGCGFYSIAIADKGEEGRYLSTFC